MGIEMLDKDKGLEPPLKKLFFEIFLEKFWWFRKSPYLCIRFPKESHEEEFFERFRYEQASSTSLT